MGCDIHMFVEYQTKVDKKQEWIIGDYFRINPYYKEGESDEPKYERLGLHDRRNYDLFATLAGVRDYTEQVIPVSEPKGFPKDACGYVKEQKKIWDGDGHTHSWVTLKELKEYQNKNPKLKQTGLLSPQQLVEFDQNGKLPDSWCQGTNMEGFERRDWEHENESLIPLIEKLQTRMKDLMSYMWEQYDEKEHDDKIRIVFWFDN